MTNHKVVCALHDQQLPAIACEHIRCAGLQTYVGWVQAEFDPANRSPGDLMAWCNACDEIYEEAGGWTDESEPRAGFRVICEQCFLEFQAKQHNFRCIVN